MFKCVVKPTDFSGQYSEIPKVTPLLVPTEIIRKMIEMKVFFDYGPRYTSGQIKKKKKNCHN